ncbi:SH3 domain-containing protein [Desulfococcaceae bacterium HSG8]|nr:SH3 domain-containing protein [Desulfococcaceae bacterium HSG8]
MKAQRYEIFPVTVTGFFIVIFAAAFTCLMPADVSHGVPAVSDTPEHIKSAGNLYEKPSSAALVIDKLQEGDSVTVIHYKDEWCIVKLPDDRVGWVNQDIFLKQGSREPEQGSVTPPIVEKPIVEKPIVEKPIVEKPIVEKPIVEKSIIEKKVTLKTSSGRVREAPSLSSDIKHKLTRGETVSVIETKGNWYRIQLGNGATGWSHQKLFSPYNPEPTDRVSGKIKEIRTDVTSEGEEKVIFVLNGFYPPETFVLEEGVPKVVCDFFGLQLAAGIKRKIKVRGRFIRRIRVGIHKDTGDPKIRVVTDLASDQNYEVEQVFFKKENLYTLTFKPAQKS